MESKKRDKKHKEKRDKKHKEKREKKYTEKRRSNEKRKERSRDAARCRRSRETDIFTELAAALPVPPDQAAQLDKASVMRLAIAYLKVRAVVDSIPVPLAKSESCAEIDELFPKALNGFMLVLSGDGNMVYLSENVSDYLGISQMDLMGQSVYEYSHPCDHDELRECLSSKPIDSADKRVCSFFLRLKCTLTSKGRKVNLKSATYKVIHCVGHLTYIPDSNSNSTKIDDDERKERDSDEIGEYDSGASLVLVGCPIPHPRNIEVPLGRYTFLSKHSLGMKFTYADEMLAEYLGWDSEELMGQSVFEFHHALDNLSLDKSFKSLFSKGQCETVAYRFLGKRGGYAWVVTQATLIHCSKQQKPLSVVCVNYILSGIENEDVVYSARQLAARDKEHVVKQDNTSVNTERIEPTKVELRVQVNGADFEDSSYDTNDEELLPALRREDYDLTKPLPITTSTFQPVVYEAKKEPLALRDGSRKDNTFPRPVRVTEKTFVGVQALKDSLEESLKDSLKENESQRKRNIEKSGNPPSFIFQGKPALEYNPEIAIRRDRPQIVTRQLFAPLSSVTQQQPPVQQQEQLPSRPPPQTTTASIFAPRTEDMNKGFLTFSEDQPGLTMLKDEPEDLTHLAPTPGDVCVPLEDTPFLSDMLDEFILGNDNYCPLLSPGGVLGSELRTTDFGDALKDTDIGESTGEKGLGSTLADSDPFMYGDSPGSPCSIGPNNVSPSLSKYRQASSPDMGFVSGHLETSSSTDTQSTYLLAQSPGQSVDSLGSPTEASGAEGLSEDEMLMLGIGDNMADDELALRAPYIPMSDQDEALEMLISDDMVMWSPSQTIEKGPSKWLIDEREQRTSDSSLAQLLKTDQSISKRYNDHGGGLVNPSQVLGQIPRKSTLLESNRWPAKIDRTERPTKRIHTASIELGNDNKRIRCEELNDNPLDIGDQLKFDMTPMSKRSPTNVGSSQLLRRLVSQQNVLRNNYSNESFENRINGRTSQNGNRFRDLRPGEIIVIDEEEGDGGGGDGEGGGAKCRRKRQNVDSSSPTNQQNPQCNSVLMNLLVSGCDDPSIESRNVPTLLRKSMTTPLSVNLDNQMVPQGPDSNGSLTFDLCPDTGKGLSGSFISGSPMVSPNSPIMGLDNFDYETSVSGSGLLQVNGDLFGGLLDRNLV